MGAIYATLAVHSIVIGGIFGPAMLTVLYTDGGVLALLQGLMFA